MDCVCNAASYLARICASPKHMPENTDNRAEHFADLRFLPTAPESPQ